MSDILCGPIIRRTTKQAVYIWLATETKRQLSGEIRLPETHKTISIDAGTRTVRLGKRLFVHLLCLKPKAGDFPSEKLLHYDIHDAGESLLTNDAEICYPGEPSPGFMIPDKLNKVLHGSCRKPHAGAAKKAWGSADQLVLGDDLMAESFADPAERPDILLMTGDQIYADDVGAPLLDHLITDGERITGWNEIMPRRRPPKNANENNALKTPDDHCVAADIKLYARSTALSMEFTGITSGAKRNHLMTFGEYAAMYLTVWGGPASRPRFQTWAQLQHRVRKPISEKTYLTELGELKIFCKTLAKVRRLLANIPVYMICDDHEITDDWFINPAWESNVHRSPRARRVIANGMAAYWAFQGWGNNPDAFDNTFVNTLEAHLNDHAFEGDKADAYDRQLWEKRPGRWGYVIPTTPAIVVMDTRTCRQAGDNDSSAAILMNSPALTWLKDAVGTAIQNGDENPFVISPTPVLGLKAIEGLQSFFSFLGTAALDIESWNRGLESLTSALLSMPPRPKSITFLSGDVHYSFMRSGMLGSEADGISVVQMTSSPLHNQPVAMRFSERDLLVREGHFIASEERTRSGATVITSINNLAVVSLDRSRHRWRQQLISILPSGERQRLTYQQSDAADS